MILGLLRCQAGLAIRVLRVSLCLRVFVVDCLAARGHDEIMNPITVEIAGAGIGSESTGEFP
jgi:hypothetical protein